MWGVKEMEENTNVTDHDNVENEHKARPMPHTQHRKNP